METTQRISQLNELINEYQNLRNGNAVENVQLNTAAGPFFIRNREAVNSVIDMLIAECHRQISKELKE